MLSVAVNPPKTPATKGSNGIAAATIPNVCKMPPPPPPFVPMPLPNIGKSGKSPRGYSTSVKIEGHTVAIRGASFGSMGDIASKASGGGIISSNVEGPTKFLAPGSLNVRIQGKNVQLLGDQMLNNCGPSGSPPNAATMMGLFQDALIAKFEQILCRIVEECHNEINDKKFGKGNKPPAKWCSDQVPGEKPNYLKIGDEKDECCTKKLNDLKQGSKTDFSRAVKVQKNVRAKGGGWIKPDVMVGQPPNCQKVYDFKSTCQLTPTSEVYWFAYKEGGWRPPPNPTYKGKSQWHAYKDACGVAPDIIHPNSPTCKGL